MLWTGCRRGVSSGKGGEKGAALRPGTPRLGGLPPWPCSADKPLESTPFKNTFFRNLLRTLEIYYIPSAAEEEKLQVREQPISPAAAVPGEPEDHSPAPAEAAARWRGGGSAPINHDNSPPAVNLDPATIHWCGGEKGLFVGLSFTGGM